jgi:hypothetical protein
MQCYERNVPAGHRRPSALPRPTAARSCCADPLVHPLICQECYKSVARVLQECYKSVIRVLPGCCKSVARVLLGSSPNRCLCSSLGCCKGVARVLQGCYQDPRRNAVCVAHPFHALLPYTWRGMLCETTRATEASAARGERGARGAKQARVASEARAARGARETTQSREARERQDSCERGRQARQTSRERDVLVSAHAEGECRGQLERVHLCVQWCTRNFSDKRLQH